MECVVWMVFLVVGVEGAGSPAHLQSEYGQLVTSSTLYWVRSGTGYTPPPNAVEAGTGAEGALVCRGKQNGILLSGTTMHSRCRVGFSGRLVSLTHYDILTSTPGASRLDWKPYNRFSAVPSGAVSGVEGKEPVFVGRKLGARGVMQPALVEIPSSGYGYGHLKVYTEYDVEDVNEGDILVEVEPIRYELVLDPFTRPPKRTEDRQVLATSSIFRFQEGRDSMARMQKMLSFSYNKSIYFGQMKGTIRGLSGAVILPNGERKTVQWGLPNKKVQSENLMVGYDMKQNSAVDVVVTGLRVREEQAYSGRLVAEFPDGSQRERRVEGELASEDVVGIQPEYSQLYLIKDQVMGSPSKLSQDHKEDGGQLYTQVMSDDRQPQSRSVDTHLSLAVHSSASTTCRISIQLTLLVTLFSAAAI